jgi:hypothetical protein
MLTLYLNSGDNLMCLSIIIWMGNRYPRFAGVVYDMMTHCPLCHDCILTESHVIFYCPSVERERRELDMVFFRNLCSSKGLREAEKLYCFEYFAGSLAISVVNCVRYGLI